MLRPAPSLVAFLLYFGASMVLGECYPLSRYGMYAVSGYDHGVGLVFLADGQPVDDLQGFRAFAGIEPELLHYPRDLPSSQEYLLDAVRHRVQTHSPATPPAGPSVELQIGYQVVQATAEGLRVVEPFVLLDQGRAWSSD